MKAIKIEDDELTCRYEDAIFQDDDSFSLVTGDFQIGYEVSSLGEVVELIRKEPNGWTTLYPSREARNDKYIAIAGETSYGGAGFIALKLLSSDTFKWLVHLSNMNNPVNVKIVNEIVHVTSDLNYPKGVTFMVPIDEPRKLKTE